MSPELSHVVLTALIGLLAWIGHNAIKKLDDHVRACDARAASAARLTQWTGDAIYTIAKKINADEVPPPPPEPKELK